MKRLSATNKPTSAPARKPKASKVVFKSKRVEPDEDINIDMVEVADIAYNRTFGFYGRAGTGKTTLAATFPGPVLLLDFKDEGTDSIADVPGVTVIQMRVWGAVEKLYWDMIENPAKYERFKTIALDTVTQMQAMCIAALLKAKGKNPGEAGGWGSMTKAEWGTASQEMKEQIDRYRDLPMTTVFLCQDRESEIDDDARYEEGDVLPEIGPNLMKSVAKSLAAAVHILGYTFLREKPPKKDKEGNDIPNAKVEYQYCLRIGPHPIYSTKVRKPKTLKVPALIINPTYTDIMDIIKGE